jgi:hypothetical protein
MRAATQLLPPAIGSAILGGLTWFLLDRGWSVGSSWPFDMSRSWLVTGVGLGVGLVRALGTAVMATVFAGFALAALSTVSLVVPSAWWTGLVVGSSAASIVLLGLFFSPSLLLGIAIDVVLLWFATASAWTPAASAWTPAGTGLGGGSGLG